MARIMGIRQAVRLRTLTPSFGSSNLSSPAKKNDKFRQEFVVFLSKPQAWYGITRKRVWDRRRRMASPKVYFLRLYSIPSATDSIQCFALIPYTPFGVIWYMSSSPYKTSRKYFYCE